MATSSPGGFFPPNSSLLSPTPSSVSSTVSPLPHPRSTPLKSGGSKESTFIRFVDAGILKVRRRFAKHAEVVEDNKDVSGYNSFADAAHDIDKLIDIIWVSGTPSLQVAYLLSLALLLVNMLPELVPAPKPTFRLLRKLDHAFASLLQGRDIDTGESLPGFGGGPKVTGTEKVRMKSLVERTRVVVTDVLSGADFEDDTEPSKAEETETEDEEDYNMGETTDDDRMDVEQKLDVDEEGEWDMEMAKVYDLTMVELGDTIGGTPIGMISDD